MQIVIKFTNNSARQTEYYLRKRYKSKANLTTLAKVAILTEAANGAKKELEEGGRTKNDRESIPTAGSDARPLAVQHNIPHTPR